jgi:hypothetical protein
MNITNMNACSWVCTGCTLMNGQEEGNCEVCGTAKPSESATPTSIGAVAGPQTVQVAPTSGCGFAGTIAADGSGVFSADIDVSAVAGLLIKRGHHLQEKWGVKMRYQKENLENMPRKCVLHINGSNSDAVDIALQGVKTILADPAGWKQELYKTKIHVFVDDSNIFYGGINQCAEDEYIDMKALLRVFQQGRWTEELCVVGSGTGAESRWRAYDDADYTKHILPKGVNGEEIGVDDTLISLVQREIDKKFSDIEERRLVVVTGDGNDNMGRVSFPEVVEKALSKGWTVEVWSWDKGRSGKWRSKDGRNKGADELSFEEMYAGSGKFSVMSLSQHRDSIIRKRTPEEQTKRLQMQAAYTSPYTSPTTPAAHAQRYAHAQSPRSVAQVDTGVATNTGVVTKAQLLQNIERLKSKMESIREEVALGVYERAGLLSGIKAKLDDDEQAHDDLIMLDCMATPTITPPPGFAGHATSVSLGWGNASPAAGSTTGNTGGNTRKPYCHSDGTRVLAPGSSHITSRGPDGSRGFKMTRTGGSPTRFGAYNRGKDSAKIVAAGTLKDVTNIAAATQLRPTLKVGTTGSAWRSRTARAAAAAGKEGSPPPAARAPAWRSSSMRGSSLEALAASKDADGPKSTLFQSYCPPCQPGSVSKDMSKLTSANCAVCKDFAISGYCAFGNRCHFQHPGKPGVGLGGKTLCHSWAATGACDHGDACELAHPQVCRFGSGCVAQRHGCKCPFFHPNASAARAAKSGAERVPLRRMDSGGNRVFANHCMPSMSRARAY